MDPFVVVLFGGLAVLVAAVWLLGRLYPGSGLEQLGMRSAREISETREALEAEDLTQMVAARNARRRARGEPEVTAEDFELQVARELGAARFGGPGPGGSPQRGPVQADEAARRAADDAEAARRAADDRDLDELLALTNARRRARGLPERTREQARTELGADPGTESS